ncbi:MAG: hypothetical protein AB1637_09625 [Elusimicrobiota bacterium]
MELVDWILNNSKRLSLNVEKYRWIDEWLPGYFDYAVEIIIQGIKYRGRGVDKIEKIAFEKACAESLERASTDLNNLCQNRWGTAAYINLPGARERAYWELLGIDKVLCHHFCKRKMKAIPIDILSEYVDILRLNRLLVKNNISFRFYELSPVIDAKIVCAISHKQDSEIKGFISGFGANKDIKKACLSALFESLRTLVVCFFDNYKLDKPMEQLRKEGQPLWHFCKAQEKESLDYLNTYLIPDKEETVLLIPENISIDDVKFKELSYIKGIFPDIPLFFVQAKSDKLLTPQFGDFLPDEKTMKRLEIFNGGPVQISTSVPHFYG